LDPAKIDGALGAFDGKPLNVAVLATFDASQDLIEHSAARRVKGKALNTAALAVFNAS
jgi:hypothetical protein